MAYAILPRPKGRSSALLAFVSGDVRYGLRDDGKAWHAFIEVKRHAGWHEVISAELDENLRLKQQARMLVLGKEPPRPTDKGKKKWSAKAMAGFARSLRSGPIAAAVSDLANKPLHPLVPEALGFSIRSLATFVRALRMTTAGKRPCETSIAISPDVAGVAFVKALTTGRRTLSAKNQKLWDAYRKAYPGEKDDFDENYPNGCTLSPDFDFTDCCDTHDIQYVMGGTEADREQADADLYYCIEKRWGWWLAGTYWAAVRIAGKHWWTTRP